MRKQAADSILGFGRAVAEHRHCASRRSAGVRHQDTGGSDALDPLYSDTGTPYFSPAPNASAANPSGDDPLYSATGTPYFSPYNASGTSGISAANAGTTDLGGIGASSAPISTIAGVGNQPSLAASLGSLFSGAGNAIAQVYKATAAPTAVTPGVYYNPATGTYSTVTPTGVSALGGINSGTLLLIAGAIVLLLVLK